MRQHNNMTTPARNMTTPARGRRFWRWAPVRVGTAAVASLGVAALVALQAPVASAHGVVSAGHGWIRFGHFSPSNGPVRVSVDGKLLTASASFETVTPYQPLIAGIHTITLAGVNVPKTVLSDHVTVPSGGAVTVGAFQASQGIVLRWFADDLSPGPAGDGKVRVIDTASTVPQLRVVLQRDTVPETALQSGTEPAASAVTTVATPIVAFGTASPYRHLAAGTYTVMVDSPTGRRLLTGNHWPVVAGTVASVVVVQSGGQVALEVLRDATGASVAPVGSMRTGFGGAANLLAAGSGRGHRTDVEILGLVLLAGLCGAGAWGVNRRSASGRRLTVVVTVGLLAAATTAGSLALASGGAGSRTAAGASSRHAAPVVAHGLVANGVLANGVLANGVLANGVVANGVVAHGVVAHGVVAHGVVSAPVIRVGASVDLSSAGLASTATAPTSLTISAIGVRSSIIELGRNADGTAQVPPTATVAGWYADGPAPGQPGPAVILGHVDSYRGPGIFFGLRQLRPGDVVTVDEAGATLNFAVQEVRSYAKTDFPTAAVFGPTPDRALRLVTCGGTFDRATGHYDDNVIAFATEVGAPAGAR